MALPITVNGAVQSWGHISVVIPEIKFRLTDFTHISFADGNEVVQVGGMGASRPTRRTSGSYKAEQTTIGGPVSAFVKLRKALSTLPGAVPGKGGVISIGGVEFSTYVSYRRSLSEPASTAQLLKCRYVGASNDHTFGADQVEEEGKLDVMGVVRDGIVLWDTAAEVLF